MPCRAASPLRGTTKADVTIGKGDRDARSHRHALARRELDGLGRVQVRTGVAGVRYSGTCPERDQNLDRLLPRCPRVVQISDAIDPC